MFSLSTDESKILNFRLCLPLLQASTTILSFLCLPWVYQTRRWFEGVSTFPAGTPPPPPVTHSAWDTLCHRTEQGLCSLWDLGKGRSRVQWEHPNSQHQSAEELWLTLQCWYSSPSHRQKKSCEEICTALDFTRQHFPALIYTLESKFDAQMHYRYLKVFKCRSILSGVFPMPQFQKTENLVLSQIICLFPMSCFKV